MKKYFCFIIFHFSRTLQFDLMLENELFAFALFLMGINDSVFDQIDFRTLCRNELWSKTEVSLLYFAAHKVNNIFMTFEFMNELIF